MVYDKTSTRPMDDTENGKNDHRKPIFVSMCGFGFANQVRQNSPALLNLIYEQGSQTAAKYQIEPTQLGK